MNTINNSVPRHVAIIMDGNGRWAGKKGLARIKGHAEGAETFRRIARHCQKIGVKFLTVYAFSTENWKRPAQEVQGIMALLEKYLFEAIEEMNRDNIYFRFFGDISVFTGRLGEVIEQIRVKPHREDGLCVNLCINYGGRNEITSAVEQIVQEKIKNPDYKINEQTVSEHLYSKGVPDPDLIIRPGGEMRISNFLIWQSAYSELYFTDTLWPDMDGVEIDRAIAEYNKRDRRFGGTGK